MSSIHIDINNIRDLFGQNDLLSSLYFLCDAFVMLPYGKGNTSPI